MLSTNGDVLSLKDTRKPVRHILCLDGTWQKSDSDSPSNVKLLYDSLSDRGKDGFVQITKHFNGVATQGNYFERALNGVTGGDLEDRIIEACKYLAKHYKPGDEVVFIGFSRGAFTARALNDMIYECGIPKDTENLDKVVKQAFQVYKAYEGEDGAEALHKFRAQYSHDIRPKTILACFDTVGALGIPEQFNLFARNKYEFHDLELNPNTVLAIHAMALNERRKNFDATRMKPSEHTRLIEQYFIGDHSAVGGGSLKNRQISDISGLWMAEQLDQLGKVGFDKDKLAATFSPDPLANPNATFEPESYLWLWKLLDDLEPREIDGSVPVHYSVIDRWADNPSYRPSQLNEVTINAALALPEAKMA